MDCSQEAQGDNKVQFDGFCAVQTPAVETTKLVFALIYIL